MTTSRADRDRIAEQAAGDLRMLAAAWRDGGAALDAAVRTNPGFGFAVLDARADGGFLRLVAARLDNPEIVLSFGLSSAGERLIVLRGGRRDLLRTDPSLATVIAGPRDEPLAHDLAWRFDIGVDETVPLPAGFATAPDGAPGAVGGERALLRALSAAKGMLDGRLPFAAGARAVHFSLRDAGIEPTPHALYHIQDESYEIEGGRAEQRAQALAALEAWAQKHGRADCEALLAQFQGPAFATADNGRNT